MDAPVPAARPTRPRDAGFRLLLGMVALMWVVEAIDSIDSHRLDADGIRPRDADGLVGVVTAPFLHVSFAHLIANTVPFVFMGLVIALSGAARLLAVTAIVAVAGGLGTWLVAPAHTVTVGASGVVFGYATYLLVRGFFDRSALELVAGVAVGAVWGAALLSSLVPRYGVSWQGHLCGAAAGVLAAWLLRRPSEVAGAPG
jgi:membrane associated rhomboid family serine protease